MIAVMFFSIVGDFTGCGDWGDVEAWRCIMMLARSERRETQCRTCGCQRSSHGIEGSSVWERILGDVFSRDEKLRRHILCNYGNIVGVSRSSATIG